jgi:hypothetical protein
MAGPHAPRQLGLAEPELTPATDHDPRQRLIRRERL